MAEADRPKADVIEEKAVSVGMKPEDYVKRKEYKKIGILMLIAGGMIVIAFIFSRVYVNRAHQGIRGNGILNETVTETPLTVKPATPVSYDTTLGKGRKENSLGQAADLEVADDSVRETEKAIAMAQKIAEQEALEAIRKAGETPVNYAEAESYMDSGVFAGFYKSLSGTALEVDDKSFTGSFAELTSVVRDGDLVMCGILYDRSNLNKVRAFPKGARESGNDLKTLYSEIISKQYTEGTYCAYLINADTITCLGGDELLCLLLDDYSTEDIAQFRADGETIESLLSNGKVTLKYGTDECADNIYEMCGIGYFPYFVETLGGTEQLSVVHLIGDKVYVENYGVGNLSYITSGVRAAGMTDVDSGEAGIGAGVEEENGTGARDGELVTVFTGYYCW